MAITYKTAPEIPERDHAPLAELLNAYWQHIIVTKEMMKARLHSGSIFLAAYEENKPLGLLETLDFPTGGVPSRIVGDYADLTSNGQWRLPEENADTLLLVDITLSKETWGRGLGKEFITSALDYIARQTAYCFVFTYTPDDTNIAGWHQKNGALPTEHRIPQARPGHTVEAVCMMDYSDEIAKRRKK